MSHSERRRRPTWAAVLLTCLLGLAPACTLDFDQFDAAPGPGGGDGGGGDTGGGDTGGVDAGDAADAGTDADTGTDQDTGGPVGTGVVGTSCSTDAECDGGTCISGYCTIGCTGGQACPDGSSCRQLAGAAWCALDCDAAGTCDQTGRDDLSCLPAPRGATLGQRATAAPSCLSDADGDGVFDGSDNCPQDANPTNVDTDDDGQGDACDADPVCPATATDGIVDYGSITAEAAALALPATTGQDWLAVVENQTADGQPSDRLLVIDRTAGAFGDDVTLPYAASGRRVLPRGRGGYAVTPGQLPSAGEIGRYILVERNGQALLGPLFSYDLDSPVFAATADGTMLAHAFGEPVNATSVWSIQIYQPGSDRFATLTTGTDADRVAWRATQTIGGNVVFYSQVQPTTSIARFIEVNAQGGIVQTRNVALPAPQSSGQPFDPVVVSGAGDVLYAFDRNTGEAVRLSLASGALTPIPDFNLTLPDAPIAFVPVGGSSSLIVLFTDPADDTKVAVREYYLPCLAGFDGRDEEGDGAADLRDNCPTASNDTQTDADDDGVGNACDPDADADGIANGTDQTTDDEGNAVSLALDTDNDGVDNADDADDDDDGLADDADPYPFDSDNDGVANAVDGDDDDDGYSDADETASATSLYDPLSFPGAGRLVWVREADAGRVVEAAGLDALDAPIAPTLDGEPPHLPRLHGGHVLALEGAPGDAQSLYWASLDPDAPTTETFSFGVGIEGAIAEQVSADGALASVLAIHKQFGNQAADQLSRVTVNPTGFEPVVALLSQMRSPNAGQTELFFLGAPAGCPSCMAPYRTALDGTQPMLLSDTLVEPTRLRRTDGGLTTVAQASDADASTSGWRIALGRGNNTEYRAPGVVEVDSIVAIPGGHVVLSGRTEAGSYDLWFYNARKARWSRVLSSPDDLIEVDWAP